MKSHKVVFAKVISRRQYSPLVRKELSSKELEIYSPVLKVIPEKTAMEGSSSESD